MVENERERQSGVWKFFSILAEKPHIAKCSDDDCGKEVPMGKPDTAKKSLGLKGLWDHLRIHHKSKYEEASKIKEEQARKRQKRSEDAANRRSMYQLVELESRPRQLTLQDSLKARDTYTKDDPRQVELESLLTRWIVDSLQPYLTLENPHFRQFITGKHSTRQTL